MLAFDSDRAAHTRPHLVFMHCPVTALHCTFSEQRNTEFGYSRKDIILIGVGLTALGYILYYGLQAGGMEPGYAGNWVQLIIFLGICVGWIGSYLFRVANKVGWEQQVSPWFRARACMGSDEETLHVATAHSPITPHYTLSAHKQQMTYVQQLDDYEAAVMKKRLEEMPEDEVARMMEEVEVEKERRGGERVGGGQ
jgi:hypothetical protein